MTPHDDRKFLDEVVFGRTGVMFTSSLSYATINAVGRPGPIQVGVYQNLPPLEPIRCDYCRTIFHDSRFHPGTCGNCGAPA